MYNTEYKIMYHKLSDDDESNKQFQSDLLSVFNIDHQDKLVEIIEKVYDHLDCKPLIELLKNHSLAMFCESDIMLFILLFNYDYFHYTHDFICEYLRTKQHGICYRELENFLKKI